MNRQYKARGIVWSGAGILLQVLGILGAFSRAEATPELHPRFAAACFIIIGTALLIVGLGWYARAKGRRPAWAAAGLFSVAGFFLVHLLADNSIGTNKRQRSPGVHKHARNHRHKPDHR